MNQSTNNKLGIFLPVRSGSERIADKNTRSFAGFEGGLLELKLRQLSALNADAVIYLSTDDEKSMEIGRSLNISNLRVEERPAHLCKSDTPLSAVIAYVPELIEEEHILWTHVTSPFVVSEDYDKAIKMYFEKMGEYDSLFSAERLYDYLWSENQRKFINFEREFGEWPRTQDLNPVHKITNAVFLCARETYLEGDRVGRNPFIYETNSFKSFDIDWMEDFNLADKVFQTVNGNAVSPGRKS